MLSWLPPFRVELRLFGKKFGDMSFGPGDDLLVSDAFQQAWVKEGLKGFDAFDPVEIVRVRPSKAAKRAPTYVHVVVRRAATSVDDERSVFIWNGPRNCGWCGGASMDAVRGFAIDEASWSGEDIFYARNLSGLRIATERVRRVAEQYGLTNINLIPVEEYIWDTLEKIVLM
jgi:hypothetical protein